MSHILSIYSHGQLFDGLLLTQVGLTVAYVISSFFVVSNPYNGFNAIVLGVIYGFSISLGYYFIRNSISRTKFGFVLSTAVILIFISLENAIFWGQYSGCQTFDSADARRLREISYFHVTRRLFDSACAHTAAMKSLCAFSVLLFLSYIFEVFILLRFKDEFLGVAPLNEGYAPINPNDFVIGEGYTGATSKNDFESKSQE